ncbi:MAG: hypothetical protein IKL80_02125, partial [Clostridia bacterium]|nr:hypothetical protein [Clostridia bacterium]
MQHFHITSYLPTIKGVRIFRLFVGRKAMEMNIQANLVSQLCQRKDITVIENAPMRSYTSFQIGGPADLLVMPQTAEGLSYSLSLLQKAGIPVTVIGAGSNLLVADA